ncbi:unnamed protein product, partial [Ectocarpus sp. 12 AP-2014]
KYPRIETLLSAIKSGVPVNVCSPLACDQVAARIPLALKYGNHNSVSGHDRLIVDKIFDDVRIGRAFVLPREAAFHIPGLNISPLGVVSSGTPESPKLRIVHDLSFDVAREEASVNDRTDFASAPSVALKHVLRNFIWRILYLGGGWPRGRIVLSKMDVAAAFRQVLVSWEENQVFAYSFGDLLVIDRRLMFGWRNSPGYFC